MININEDIWEKHTFGEWFLHFLEGHIGQTIHVVDNCYTWINRPNQDLYEGILLISIDYHGLPPKRVEITPQPKNDQLWRPKTTLKMRFSTMFYLFKKLDINLSYNILKNKRCQSSRFVAKNIFVKGTKM